MRKLFLLVFIAITSISYGQIDTLQVKLDSILQEANLLYSYEKAVWNATDIIVKNGDVFNNYGGYVVSHSNDTVFATFLDKSLKRRIAEYKFTFDNLFEPFDIDYKSVKLSKSNKELIDIKIKIVDQLVDKKYDISFPEGFTPNLVLLKGDTGFRLYIIMGTSESGLIPFGNDYIFKSDKDGKIYEWRKFHSRIIPTPSRMESGEKVLTAIHSHLKTTPYITATDICTFRLYGELCGMNSFMVSSTALGLNFSYNLEKNEIEVIEKF